MNFDIGRNRRCRRFVTHKAHKSIFTSRTRGNVYRRHGSGCDAASTTMSIAFYYIASRYPTGSISEESRSRRERTTRNSVTLDVYLGLDRVRPCLISRARHSRHSACGGPFWPQPEQDRVQISEVAGLPSRSVG